MTVYGLDVSRWQGNAVSPGAFDWNKAKSMGIRFAFIKATQGLNTDREFIPNWDKAKKAGILRGAYCYMDWSVNALDQAKYFFSAVTIAGDAGELPLVVDFESRAKIPGAANMRGALKIFLEELTRLSGRRPIIYTAPGYWREFGSGDMYWAQYPLWIANYEVMRPTVPAPWTKWSFWQYTDKGDGYAHGAYSKQIDLDYFNGSEAEFMSMANQPVNKPAEVSPIDCKNCPIYKELKTEIEQLKAELKNK